MNAPVLRFAPSPTGLIHIGNARTALLNFLLARAGGGRFILRFDDTDTQRSREDFARAIEVDLSWLGIEPDAIVRQSQRLDLYRAAAQRLIDTGRLYRAYETADELARKRKRQQSRGAPPVYDRAALALTAEDHARFAADGQAPHWRFRLGDEAVTWADGVRGDTTIDLRSLSDPVLVRADGTFLYTFTSVVDDLDLGITTVVRGEDHVTNTAVQIELFRALGGPDHVPLFAHHNLLLDTAGAGLSKRTGALSLASLREDGVEALAVAALAVLTGSSDEVHPVGSLAELATKVHLSHLSRNSARFDTAELFALSARTLHRLPFEAVRDRLAALDIVGFQAEPFWLAVRGNLSRFADVADWWRVVAGEIEPRVEDEALCGLAGTLLPQEPLDEASWSTWTAALRGESGRKGRALFHPLRVALTGREDGPELAKLLPLMGRARALRRLSGIVSAE